MTVRVEFYSFLRDLVGDDEAALDLPDDATMADVLERAYSRWPALRQWDGKLLLAADLDYVDRSRRVCPGEVISLMPPVQGG
jgi:molybdopterin converting factor small subunit